MSAYTLFIYGCKGTNFLWKYKGIPYEKQKKCYFSYEERKRLLEAVRYVDLVIPERTWEQKRNDVLEYKVDKVVMGSDWEGNPNFECLKDICEVVYLPRTEGISTTKIKNDLKLQEPINGVNQIPNN